MDRIQETSSLIVQLNRYFKKEIQDYEFIKDVCSYFDNIKNERLTPSDLKFLKYISNIVGIPHYYDLLFNEFKHKEKFNNFDLNTMSAMIYESTLHIDENIKIHKYQKEILNRYKKDIQNRFFLSATTSFGKTFLIYEIIKKMNYKNIVLIFPTIALLSENYERIMIDKHYQYFHDKFSIHTLSEVKEEEIGEQNIFVFTPERYLSFMDKNPDLDIDFVFVDEIYKIDNEYIIDSINRENERDTAYRVALFHILQDEKDILLVGPYIEFPNQEDNSVNQSFNNFLNKNNFEIINYNNFDIVNKSYTSIGTSEKYEIDENLTINLKDYKKVGERLGKIITDIRNIDENTIIYTKGAGTAESKAQDVIQFSEIKNSKLNKDLKQLIGHLKKRFKVKNWSLIEGLENKIGIHHGLIPKYIQKEIIKLFNNRNIDVLISTTTITEGVNTSAKNLIVLNAWKGKKPLKTFDAKNIAGRAGRFLHHYSGRVIIMDKKFKEIMDGSDNEIQHKNYDEKSPKDEIDYFITDEEFLNNDDRKKRKEIKKEQEKRGISDEIMQMYKVISHSDKIRVYDNVLNLSPLDYRQINQLIRSISYNLFLDRDGFTVILRTIYPIIKNENLKFLIENISTIKKGKDKGKTYSTLTYMLSAYLENGFMGSVKYNLTRKKKLSQGSRNFTTDEAIRESSNFIFNTLKYQLVKYLGIFNIMYKYIGTQRSEYSFDEIKGIDKLLMKLEYNATSEKGRLASDYGVPNKIIEYYDNENDKDKIKSSFDKYEEKKFEDIERIINRDV